MLSTIITNTIRRFIPAQCQPLTIEDVYPCLVGQAERNQARMDQIKAEMGTKYILHPSHMQKRLKKARPV